MSHLQTDIAALDRAVVAAAPRIVRVIRVVDTRVWEEGPDDRSHPIAGSGKEHECSRCHRMHEIHAEVELSDGTEQIVGTGCAARESMNIAAQIRTAEAREKSVRRLRSQLAKNSHAIAAYQDAERQVAAMPRPPIVEGTAALSVGRDAGKQQPALYMGDECVWTHLVRSPRDLAERRETLARDWQDAQIRRILGVRYVSLPALVDEGRQLARKLARLEKSV